MKIIILDKQPYSVPDKILGLIGVKWELEEQIGIGGNSVVHQCSHPSTGETYAIKFFALGKRRQLRAAIEIDVLRTVATYKHPHIIRYFDHGVVMARRDKKDYYLKFMVMERADQNLRDFVSTQSGRIKPVIYLAQIRGLVSALVKLHNYAIHRDIKPENILIIGERWIISDFGLAKKSDAITGEGISYDGEVIGPRFWMSPEAINCAFGYREQIDTLSDVFQIASVFWWVINQRHPSGILRKDDWQGLEKLFSPIERALEHSPSRRYPSAEDFERALIDCINAE